MKSQQITKRLKELFGVSTNDKIVPAIEAALSAKIAAPLGATVIIANGQVSSTPFGLSNPPRLEEVEVLQRVFRSLADSLDQQKVALIRAEVEAQVNETTESLEHPN